MVADDLAILRICSGSNQPKQNDKKYSRVRPHLEIFLRWVRRCGAKQKRRGFPAPFLVSPVDHVQFDWRWRERPARALRPGRDPLITLRRSRVKSIEKSRSATVRRAQEALGTR